MIYELIPTYDHAKSFYHKARVEQHATKSGFTIVTLYSYDTPVLIAGYHHADYPIIYRTWDDYSVTTQRHIDEFLCQNCWEYNAFNEPRTGKKAWSQVEYLSKDDALKRLKEMEMC